MTSRSQGNKRLIINLHLLLVKQIQTLLAYIAEKQCLFHWTIEYIFAYSFPNTKFSDRFVVKEQIYISLTLTSSPRSMSPGHLWWKRSRCQ